MKYTIAAVVASAAVASAQGVGAIYPPGGTAAGCATSSSQTYQLTVVKEANQKRSLQERDDGVPLELHLQNSILTDAKGRIGSIVANRQFQFDGPPAQTGAVYTAGWSICPNNSLAIGPNTEFFQCLSGGFYNLYDQSVGAQCSKVTLQVIPVGASSGAGVSQQPDGQPTGAVGQQPDGQPTGPSATYVPVTQIGDGQIQATQAVTQIGDGQVQAPTGSSNVTLPSPTPSIQVGGASSMVASGAVVALGAAAMLFL